MESNKTTKEEDNKELKESNNKKALIIGIIVVLIIALAFAFKMFNTSPEEIPVAEEPVQEELIVEEEIIVVDTIVETPVVEEANKNFAVIGGSFKEEAKANKFNEKLQNNGFDSKISLTKNNFYCVSYSMFETKRDAINYLRTKRNEGVKVWILYIQ